jgi:CRISPR-associated protein Csm4
MARALHRATLTLNTPLGTPLAGDTLFGQLCWALREATGEAELTRRLEGYTRGQPWLVVSGGFPAAHLPKPTLPQQFEPQADLAARKAAKKQHWIPAIRASDALATLLASAVDDATAYDATPYGAGPFSTVQPHNTLNRLTGTTGEGAFAPYTMPQTFHAPGQRIDVYLVLDEDRVSSEEANRMFAAIGTSGFGRDASTGLGKFTITQLEPVSFAAPTQANAYWTLAPCAPQGQKFDGSQSYWRVLTRFGRHGNAHALAGNPFKTPVLMASTGAVFKPTGEFAPRLFIGQGLGGEGQLSKAEPATVHQGYAPVLPIAMESRTT